MRTWMKKIAVMVIALVMPFTLVVAGPPPEGRGLVYWTNIVLG